MTTRLRTTKEVIEYFKLTKEERPGVFYKGFCSEIYFISDYLNYEYWTQEGDFSDGPYRRVFINTDEHAILTYCEHDLRLQICEDALEFYKKLVSAAEFYLEH